MGSTGTANLESEELAAGALKAATAALANLVCPFADNTGFVLGEEGARLKRYDRYSLPKQAGFPGEVAALSGVPRIDETRPTWKREDVMTFHIDRIEFDHGIDDAALRVETVATRWRLIGHIQDGQGKPLSGPGLLEMSPNTLAARMKTMPALARVDASTLEAALAAYEQARSEWNICLATEPDEVSPPQGPRPV